MHKRRKTIEHQWLELMDIRGGLSTEDQRRLEALEIGYEGECTFDFWMERYGDEQWRVYRDIWIDAGGPTQVDTMVVTETGVFIFDVKNYSGDYAYLNGRWSVNGRPIIKDIFVQLKRSMEKVHLMLRQIDLSLQAEGLIVFINEHFTFESEAGIDERFVMRHTLKKHLQTMDEGSVVMRMPIDMLCRRIESYFIDNPYPAPACDDDAYSRLKKGVRCAGCGGFRHMVMRYHLKCLGCGNKEAKEHAVLRSICEYGVLRNDRNLRVRNIIHFVDNIVSERYVRFLLAKHFEAISRGKHAAYKNMRQVWEYCDINVTSKYKDRKI
ncbi:NERD domain-containing protein [Salinicoccus sp. ID82-1]|uniref:nuclease-related domain-containing protein n=1 Tax=Salinicoccus sp. ID82-1 TaxID=2820269 RepID=UPI001F36FD5C|nr:nuclease-related domain-containing protein [Salinicoccus sp. ID82-1]MCG1008555.1 NERD domain-containing protein [Salinicoccus sp. ID82-1]